MRMKSYEGPVGLGIVIAKYQGPHAAMLNDATSQQVIHTACQKIDDKSLFAEPPGDTLRVVGVVAVSVWSFLVRSETYAAEVLAMLKSCKAAKARNQHHGFTGYPIHAAAVLATPFELRASDLDLFRANLIPRLQGYEFHCSFGGNLGEDSILFSEVSMWGVHT